MHSLILEPTKLILIGSGTAYQATVDEDENVDWNTYLCQWKRNVPQKFQIPKIPAVIFRYSLLQYELGSSNRKFQTFGKPRKKQLWGRCWVWRMFTVVGSGEISSPRHILIDKTNDCVMNYDRNVPCLWYAVAWYRSADIGGFMYCVVSYYVSGHYLVCLVDGGVELLLREQSMMLIIRPRLWW